MTVVRSDTFTRANVASGWGTATDGNTWTVQSGNGQSVATNEGVIAASTASTFATLGAALSGADAEGLVRFAVHDTTGNTAGILLRWTDASNHWLCRYNGAAGVVNVMVKVGGTYTSLTPTFTFSPSLGAFYWLRFRCQGTTISFKVWADGSGEPGTWTEQYTNSSQNVAGATGLYGFASTDIDQFDHFSVDDLVTTPVLSGTITETDTAAGALTAAAVALSGTLTPVETAGGHLIGGTGIGDLAVSQQTQSWSGGPPNSPGTETDITYTDATGSGWSVGIIPSYGGDTIAPFYQVDNSVAGPNQTSLTTSIPDGHIHVLEQTLAGVFSGSEDKPFTISEQAPTGTPFRRYYVGTFGPDANGFFWSVSTCIYPGDPGFLAYRFDCTNPNAAPISMATSDSLEIALIGGLQQTDTTWAPANGGYGTLAGANNTGWPAGLLAFDPDYVYITPAAASSTALGVATIKQKATSAYSPAWANPTLTYLQNASRLKLKLQGDFAAFPANTTSTIYLLNVLRRNLSATDVRAIAADYLHPGTPTGPFTTFSYDERAFVYASGGAPVTTTLDLSAAALRFKPVLKLTGWTNANAPLLTWGATTLVAGTDYRYTYDSANSVLYLQLYYDVIPTGSTPGNGQRANAALTISAPVTALAGTLTPADTAAATLTAPAATLVGTAAPSESLAGAPLPPAATLSGTVAASDTAAAPPLAPAATLSGTATASETTAATLLPPAATLSGVEVSSDALAATLLPPAAALGGVDALSDTLAGALTPTSVALSGALAANETAAAALTTPPVTLAGTLTPSDTLAGALTLLPLAFGGTLTPNETLAGALTPATVALTGSLAPSDTLAGALSGASVALAGALAPSDTLAGLLLVNAVTLTGALAATDTVAALLLPPTATLSGALAASDTLAAPPLTPAVPLAGTLSAADTLTGALVAAGVTLAGTLADAETMAAALTPPAVALAGTLAPSDTLAAALLLLPLAGTLTPSDTAVAQLTTGLFGTLTASDTLGGALTLPAVALSGALAASDTAAGVLSAFFLFAGTLTPQDTLAGVLLAGIRRNNEAITTDDVLLALAVVLPAGTQQAIAGGSVAINDESALALDTAAWPALLIMEGAQETMRINARTWQKKLTVYVFYLALWTETPETNDQIWADVNADMELMLANLTDNPTLTCVLPGAGAASRNCLELVALEPSPRTQKVIDDRTYRGVPVVQRMLTIKVNLPPYVTVG